MRRSITRTPPLLWIIAFLITSCVGSLPVPTDEEAGSVPTLTSTQSPAATLSLTGTSPTITATLSPEPATPTPEMPAETITPVVRPPSGWTLYSNPDFVQGIALQDQLLWAATLGGVVRWDLDSQTPTLFTTRDGLVEIQSNDIAVCDMPETQILVAHETGILSAYNPRLAKWSRIPITFDDGSTVKSVQTLLCDPDNGRLLVGAADGLGIMEIKTGRWRFIGQAEGLEIDTIRAIDVVGQTIWVAAGDDSAFMIMGSTIFPFNGASGFPSGPVNDLSVAPDLSIWLGYPTGLVHYQDRKWNSFGGQTSAGIPFISVDHVQVGQDRTVWIASAEVGVCPFELSSLSCSTVYPAPRESPITDLLVDSNGVAYASTNGSGVMVLLPEKRINLALHNQQLISNEVFDIAGSQDGTLWLATSMGLNMVDLGNISGPWQAILPKQGGLASPRISNLLTVAEGIWIFYDQEPQASFFDGQKWAHLGPVEGMSGAVQDAAIDQRGYIWFATDRGINIWDGAVMRSYGPATGLSANQFNALFEKDGEMWVGTDQGLLNFRRYQWRSLLSGIPVNAIIQDMEGGLLLGTDQGLIRFDGNQSYQWILNFGEEILLNPVVTTLTWDLNDHLWVGTDGLGLFSYDGEKWEQFDTTSGLPTNRIRKVYTDRLGAVWIATVTDGNGGALVRYMP